MSVAGWGGVVGLILGLFGIAAVMGTATAVFFSKFKTQRTEALEGTVEALQEERDEQGRKIERQAQQIADQNVTIGNLRDQVVKQAAQIEHISRVVSGKDAIDNLTAMTQANHQDLMNKLDQNHQGLLEAVRS